MMRTILMIFIFDLIVALSPPAQAQQQMTGMRAKQPSDVQALNGAAKRPPVRLKQFEDFALANNPTLRQAADLAQASKALARQSGLYPNPVAGYEGGEIRGGSFGGGEQGAFVQQTIVLGGKLGLRKRVFQAQQKEDEAGIALQRYRVISDVEQRFYSALAAQRIVGLRQTILNVTRDAAETTHQLANVGQADLPDVFQAEVEADEARVEFATAQLNYIQAFKTLAATSGRPDLPVSWLKGNLTAWPEINPQQVIATILRNSPAVARAQASVTRPEAV
ncbi:MAG: TolC family protein, partial [Terriglobia bacterium]